MDPLKQVTDRFVTLFNKRPLLYAAPGRINLIGEHVDYNEGLVMPAAIDRCMYFAIAPGSNERCNVFALDQDEGVTFSVFDLNPGETWVNYLHGVLDGMHRKGRLVGGVDFVFGGNIPAGAGLSSSAALCAGFSYALNDIFNLRLEKSELALIAQYAEHEFAGVNCGLMDQYASLCGQKDSLLYLDCRTLAYEVLPFNFPDITILLVDTKVKHSLAASAYNDRRWACEVGVSKLRQIHPKVTALRDVTRVMLYEQREILGEEIFQKCQFVVEEIQRTRDAAGFLRQRDIRSFGELMYQSHWGLSKNYEVSCEELDFLVTLAEENKSMVVGARMMGGGFGGCTINLISTKQVGIFREKVREKYFATFKKEPDFYQVNLSEGVHRIST